MTNLTGAVERARGQRDAHYFIFDSRRLMTKDEHDAVRPVKPMYDCLYLRAVLDCLLVSGRCLEPGAARFARDAGLPAAWMGTLWDTGLLFVEKSRQVLLTWLLTAYCLWRARSRPHQLILIQSKREDDAANLVFVKHPHVARMSFIESRLPPTLQMVRFPRGGTYGHLYFPNGSHVWGIPEGGEIIRSNTPSVVFSDESAFQPDFGASYTAALPAVKGGGQYIAVSSAEPGEFAALVEAA